MTDKEIMLRKVFWSRMLLRLLLWLSLLHPLTLLWDAADPAAAALRQLFMLASLCGVWCYRSHVLGRCSK